MVKRMTAVVLFSVASICYGDTFDFFSEQEITDDNAYQSNITTMEFVSDDVFVVTYAEVGETCDLQAPEGTYDSYIVAGKIDGSEVLYGTPLKWRSGEAFGNYCTCPEEISISKLDEFKFILAYSDDADYDHGAAQVGCVDDETFAITMGDRSVFHGNYCSGTTIWTEATVCDSDQDCVNTVSPFVCDHGEVQGDIPGWGCPYYGCKDVRVLSPSTDFFVVAYTPNDNRTACRNIRPGTVSGTEITWGEAIGGWCDGELLDDSNGLMHDLVALDSTHIVWFWSCGWGQVPINEGRAAVVTVNGSSLSVSTTHQWGGTNKIYHVSLAKIDSDTIVAAYGNMSTSTTEMSLVNVNTGTGAFDFVSTVNLSDVWYSVPQAATLETNHVVATNRTSTSQFRVTDAEVDGNTLTVGDTSAISYQPMAVSAYNDGEGFVIITQQGIEPACVRSVVRSHLSTLGVPAAKPLPENASSLSCDDVGDCSASPNGFLCTDELCYTRKNRYLSIVENTANTGLATARRIQWKEDPQSTALTIGWVGEPDANGFAPVSDEAHYTDWTTEPAVIHVYGCAISPDLDYVYLVQSIYQGNSTSNEDYFSEPLTLGTAHFGDITNATLNGPPDGVANLSDILAACNAINNSGQSFPAIQYADITGTDAMENIPNRTVNMSDLLDVIDAFGSSNPYPYYAPDECP